MAIWSLTQERVEKILRHIGDKEMEIDTLLKLSSKDLWTRDLDAFLEEWHHQLEDEKQRKKKIAGISRRASAKLGISVKAGGRKKKRAGSDDESSDDEFVVSKKKGPKSVMDRVKPKAPSTLMSFFNQPATVPPKQPAEKKAVAPKPAAPVSKPRSKSPADDEDDFMEIDEPEVQTEVVAVKKPAFKAKPAASKLTNKPKKIVDLSDDDDDDDDDVFAAVAEEARTKKAADTAPSRAARAKKPTKYVIDDDSDSDSNGDDMLGDVSMMVKGIGGANGEASSRPLFTATARPGSSHGLPKSKPKSRSRSISDEDGIDDTDYTKLIPQDSPRRPAARNANDTMLLDDEDEESFGLPPPKAASKAKPAPKPAAKPVAKKTVAPKTKPAPAVAAAAKKVIPLSPAAKAYARKLANGSSQAKPAPKKKAYESDSEEEGKQDEEVNKLADQLLSDEDEDMDDEDSAPVARPSRRAAVAAVTKTKKYVVSDEEESEEEETEMTFDDDEESD
jgi:DNA topoisomerase-2